LSGGEQQVGDEPYSKFEEENNKQICDKLCEGATVYLMGCTAGRLGTEDNRALRLIKSCKKIKQIYACQGKCFYPEQEGSECHAFCPAGLTEYTRTGGGVISSRQFNKLALDRKKRITEPGYHWHDLFNEKFCDNKLAN
jgi:hypothetical protein